MIEELMADISQQVSLAEEDAASLKELLAKTIETGRSLNAFFTLERGVGLGIHLLAFMRRVREKEYLEPVDPSLLSQVSSDAFNVSRQLLTDYGRKFEREIDDTEALLLAVHLEAARNSQS